MSNQYFGVGNNYNTGENQMNLGFGLDQVNGQQPVQGNNSGLFGVGGAVSNGLNIAGGLFNAYTGYQQLKLAQDQASTNNAFAQTNLANQARTYNTNLEERYKSRASAQGNTENAGLAGYMEQNRVSGSI